MGQWKGNCSKIMKLSLCITTYNRVDLTLTSFQKVKNDPRIDEIVIVDDCSTLMNWNWLKGAIHDEYCTKVVLKRNNENLGMSRNKNRAIELAKNEWCILLDSDNVIDSSYIDAWEKIGKEKYYQTIFCPSGALPAFDYTAYSTALINKYNVNRLSEFHPHTFNCLLNTCNYIVHRDTYLKNYTYDPSIKAADTIWHTYNHLKNGGNLYVVPGMFYEHMVHADSGWMLDRKENSKKFQEIKKMIMAL